MALLIGLRPIAARLTKNNQSDATFCRVRAQSLSQFHASAKRRATSRDSASACLKGSGFFGEPRAHRALASFLGG
jgi:hypothetical protein